MPQVAGIGNGNGRHQSLRVGVLRIAEDRVARPRLDDAPEIRYGDAVTDVLHSAYVVRYEEERSRRGAVRPRNHRLASGR